MIDETLILKEIDEWTDILNREISRDVIKCQVT